MRLFSLYSAAVRTGISQTCRPKPILSALLLVWLACAGISIRVFADDYPFSVSMKQEEGLRIISAIPEENYFSTFCGLIYEISDGRSLLTKRIEACKNVIPILKQRLIDLNDKKISDPIDIEFLLDINEALLGIKSQFRKNSSMTMSFDMTIVSRGLAEEFIKLSEDMEKITDISPVAITRCPDEEMEFYIIKSKEDPESFKNDEFMRLYNRLLKCHKEKRQNQTLPGSYYFQSVNKRHTKKMTQFMHDAFKETRMPVISVASATPDALNEMATLRVYTMPTDFMRYYLQVQILRINGMFASSDWKSERVFEAGLALEARAFFIAQPFKDGNTRTAHILLNFMRLVAGLEPLVSIKIPSIKNHTSWEIINGFTERKLPPNLNELY